MHDRYPKPVRNLREHSFYRRWVSGRLSLSELREYAVQYSQVVTRMPIWLRMSAAALPAHRDNLLEQADEEDIHIGLWIEFALALGLDGEAVALSEPNPTTKMLINLADEHCTAPTGLAVAWALKAQTPTISIEKLRGLELYYGIGARNGGAYFEVQAKLDAVHALELNGIVAAFPDAQLHAAERTARKTTDFLWDLLSSVEQVA